MVDNKAEVHFCAHQRLCAKQARRRDGENGIRRKARRADENAITAEGVRRDGDEKMRRRADEGWKAKVRRRENQKGEKARSPEGETAR